jgi:hypothetical protein
VLRDLPATQAPKAFKGCCVTISLVGMQVVSLGEPHGNLTTLWPPCERHVKISNVAELPAGYADATHSKTASYAAGSTLSGGSETEVTGPLRAIALAKPSAISAAPLEDAARPCAPTARPVSLQIGPEQGVAHVHADESVTSSLAEHPTCSATVSNSSGHPENDGETPAKGPTPVGEQTSSIGRQQNQNQILAEPTTSTDHPDGHKTRAYKCNHPPYGLLEDCENASDPLKSSDLPPLIKDRRLFRLIEVCHAAYARYESCVDLSASDKQRAALAAFDMFEKVRVVVGKALVQLASYS